jgi:sugar/nucleoside kinase (ribokinase family)
VARQQSAVVAGHICLDVIPEISGLTPEEFRSSFAPGRLTTVGPALFSTGGAASNTGLALHRLGIATSLMGKVGDDPFGHMIRDIVARASLELASGMIIDQGSESSYTLIVSPPGIDRIFLHYPGANDTFRASDVRYGAVASVSLFHFGYPPLMARFYSDDGTELATLYRRAKETGVTTSLDMALPNRASPAGRADWRTILTKTLPYVDIFLPSIEEILVMLRAEQHDALAAAHGGDVLEAVSPELLHDVSDELLAMGPKIVGLKLGHLGFYLRTAGRDALAETGRAAPANLNDWAGRELWSPCFCVEVVGTTGSGDCTIAGFLAGLLRDQSPEDAVNSAVAVGACNVEAAGALSGVRTWPDTMTRIASGWRKHAMSLEATGWGYDPERQLWGAGLGQHS